MRISLCCAEAACCLPIRFHGFLNVLMDILTIEEDFMCLAEWPRLLTKRLKTTVHAVFLLNSFWRWKRSKLVWVCNGHENLHTDGNQCSLIPDYCLWCQVTHVQRSKGFIHEIIYTNYLQHRANLRRHQDICKHLPRCKLNPCTLFQRTSSPTAHWSLWNNSIPYYSTILHKLFLCVGLLD